jgi:hypothetical protein
MIWNTLNPSSLFLPETLIKRQATRQGWNPSLRGDWDKYSEIVSCKEKKILCVGPTRATNEGPLTYVHVLIKSPFASVSGGHPSPVSLVSTLFLEDAHV